MSPVKGQKVAALPSMVLA